VKTDQNGTSRVSRPLGAPNPSLSLRNEATLPESTSELSRLASTSAAMPPPPQLGACVSSPFLLLLARNGWRDLLKNLRQHADRPYCAELCNNQNRRFPLASTQSQALLRQPVDTLYRLAGMRVHINAPVCSLVRE
jgi:hypothetical protein